VGLAASCNKEKIRRKKWKEDSKRCYKYTIMIQVNMRTQCVDILYSVVFEILAFELIKEIY